MRPKPSDLLSLTPPFWFIARRRAALEWYPPGTVPVTPAAGALSRRGWVEAGKRAAGLAAAVIVVMAASALALASEALPRFFWDLKQWNVLAPTLVIGVALQLAAWAGWSLVAWVVGRVQGSRASFLATLTATGIAYLPALMQGLALLVNTREPAGVTVAALVKVVAAGLVAVAVTASLARTQDLPWPRAALSGIGWLGIALLVAAGYSQRVSLFGVHP